MESGKDCSSPKKNSTVIPVYKDEKLLFKSKFLSLYQKNFEIENKNAENVKVPYDVVEYNCRRNPQRSKALFEGKHGVYGTFIIPIIKYPKSNKKPKIILISNFRYPLKNYCIELPGGFIDQSDFGDTENLSSEVIHNAIIKGALRELKEETGYTGKFLSYGTDLFQASTEPHQESHPSQKQGAAPLTKDDLLRLECNVFSDPWKSADNGVSCIVEIDGDSEENKSRTQKLDFDELIKVFEVDLDCAADFVVKKMREEGWACVKSLHSFLMGMKFFNYFNCQ